MFHPDYPEELKKSFSSKEALFGFLPESLNIHALERASVKRTLSMINTDEAFNLNDYESRDFFLRVKESFKDWTSEVIDLAGFEYCYPSYGINGALDLWLKTLTSGIQMIKGDYKGLEFRGAPITYINNASEVNSNLPLYITNPSTKDGCFRDDWQEILNSGAEINLDLAYIGTFSRERVEINKNVQRVFLSLSKSFALGGLRIGFFFSKKPEKYQLQSWYYHRFAYYCAKEVMRRHSVFDLPNKLKTYQKEICKTLGLSPSDNVLLAHNLNDPNFAPWSRSGINRVCLTPAYSCLRLGDYT